MTSGVQRWYPSLKSSQSPAKNQFENNRFEEWKQNIINLDPQTAIKKYGHGDTFNALKKLHNFFKSGQDTSTQTEAINSCFKNDDTGFDIAFNELRYDRHSTPGWAYYSSRDEKIGLEKQIDANGRLYLNAEPIDTFDIAEKFIDACKDLNLPYEFKINRDPDRSDAMVIYVNNKSLGDYVSVISKILDENPEINQRIGEPPLLSEKISSKIGYGDEKVGTSYNNRQCEHFQKVIESTALSYRGPAPEEIQKRVRFLYVNQHEKFLKTIKERL